MRLGPNKLMAGALALAVLVGVTTLTGQLIKDAGDPAPVVREYLDAIAARIARSCVPSFRLRANRS